MHRKSAVRSCLIVVYSSSTLDDHVIPTFGTDWQLFCMDSEWCSFYSSLNVSTKKLQKTWKESSMAKIKLLSRIFSGKIKKNEKLQSKYLVFELKLQPVTP